METPVVRSRGRPRKRRREENRDVDISVKSNVDEGGSGNNEESVKVMSNSRKRGRPPRKRLVEIRGQAFVGRYVMKEFEGSGVFVGKVVSYDSGLYRVEYEDGDCEDFDSGELREVLIGNEREFFVGDLLERKMMLDGYVAKKLGLKLEGELVKTDMAMPTLKRDVIKVEVPRLSKLCSDEINGSEDDDDSSSDSCEYGQDWEARLESEIPTVPPPELPPSSMNIGVPEEYVPHLLSVCGFLRSFSIRLFLSPFSLDDLVGCLNSTVPCTLLDSIHVALLMTLRQLLESLAFDGSELASKCLRCIDWGLLDMLTWPVYLVHYLMTMGHLQGIEWNGFYSDVLEKDYCTLSVGMKLTVLQILCDDALDNAEIREEIDMRGESEFGIDSDGLPSLEIEPKKVHPRHCKKSVGKDRDIANMKRENVEENTINGEEDRNVDECRLCGMEGMLLCCDGCPLAFHSRCIGVSKLSIPEGEWFCPECTFNRIGPAINSGTSLRGAELFGVDAYAQLFLGTCDHLLVLKVSVKTTPFFRYYNCKDIVKVVNALCATPYHAAIYMRICEAILKHWGLPRSAVPSLINRQMAVPSLINSQIVLALENRSETIVLPTQVHPFRENGSHEVFHSVEHESMLNGLDEGLADNVLGSTMEKSSLKHCSSDVMLGVTVETDLSNGMLNGISTHVEKADGSSITGNISGVSGNNSSNTAGHNNGVPSSKNFSMLGKGGADSVLCRTDKNRTSTCSYMGSIFKSHAYINHFVHGEYAASAAANFSSLLSDEIGASEIHASDPRKAISANISAQAKAFASAAVRFFWPSTEKKLIEVPRERCSRCLHCKASVASKKACLLNQAALNATKAEMKFFSNCRLTKNVEGGFYSITIYILYLEESLCGLMLGPFKSAAYREKWRKKVEEASTCRDLKSCLLELEENLATIALSSEWTKLVDNWMDESSVSQSACPIGSTQKRGPGRHRKHLAPIETTPEDDNDDSNDITWWRGGKLAKLVLRKATLPSSVLKKSARQGGSRRMPGVYYADSSDVPKRSRQFIWRSAVEMARNVSQLALQVRYLDHYIKWSDLVFPEQSVQDGKGSDPEASAFRSALVCDKKVVDNKIIYGLVFGNPKYLSTRLMKSVIEKETREDGKDKYWFSEIRLPLYLIKEYEEKAQRTLLLPPNEPLKELPKGSLALSKLQQKQVRAFRRNVFRYLVSKRDNFFLCLCTSCPKEVLIDFAATCSTCKGYCHKECTLSSTLLTEGNVESATFCKKCSRSNVVTQNNIVESPTSPLALQGQEYQNSTTCSSIARPKNTSQPPLNSAAASKSTKLKIRSQKLPPCGTPEIPSDKKPTKIKKRSCHWGLIWKKKPTDDGSNFRLKNILFKGSLHDVNVLNPECHLCKKPYNPDLMYISCETCHHWYHADAVELNRSKLPNLVGFKCTRCRRIKSPVCPFADPDVKKAPLKKLQIRDPKEEVVAVSSASEAMSEQAESVPSTPISEMEDDDIIQMDDDPLLMSVSEVDQIPEARVEVDFVWSASLGPGAGPQKLPVRRQVKNEKNNSEDPEYFQTKDDVIPPNAEWDVSYVGDDFDDGVTIDDENFNNDNIDYQPQPLFSYTDSLDTEGNEFQRVNWQSDNSCTGLLSQCEVEPIINDAQTEYIETADYLPCDRCSEIEPVPDLSCQNCGLKTHSHCSPWEEYSQRESWSCGHCRSRRW